MMKFFKNIYNFINCLSKRLSEDSVYSVSGHSALFLIISFFPFVMLLLAAVKYMPFSEEQVIELFDAISMGSINETIRNIIKDIYNRSGSFALSVTAITLIWSASTSVYSITLGLNKVYNIKETRNYFLLRLYSIIYTIIFISSLFITLILMVFGKSIINYLEIYFPIFNKFNFLLNFGRFIVAIFAIILIFDLLYTIIPNRKSNLILELPGAIFASIGWYIFSYFYSLYIQYFSNMSYVYGSLTAIVLLMIWLYFCMYIFFMGAEINQVAKENGWFKKLKKRR